MSYRPKSYEEIVTINHHEYRVNAHFDAQKILTIHVTDKVPDIEFKQEYSQNHFQKGLKIDFVAQTVISAVTSEKITERVRITLSADQKWCYLTIDNGYELPSFALPNITDIGPAFPYSPKHTSPRHYRNNIQQNSTDEVAFNGTKLFSSKKQSQSDSIKILDQTDGDTSCSDDDDDDVLMAGTLPTVDGKKPIKMKQMNRQNDKKQYKFVGQNQNGNDTTDTCEAKNVIGYCLHCITLLLSLCYTVIACVYGIAQLYTLTYSDFWCGMPRKTLEEIRDHNNRNDNPWGEEYSCYQVHGNPIDYKKLFSSHPSSAYQSELNYNQTNLSFSIIFFVIALIFVFVVIWDICYIIYRKCTDNNNIPHSHPKLDKNQDSMINKIKRFYILWFSTDTTVWVISRFSFEIVEIAIQTIALLSYGGFNVFDRNELVLAELPGDIIGFAVIILINTLLFSILWILYASFPRIVFGYPFSYTLFVIDAIFDNFYILYPLLIYGEIDSDSIGQFRLTEMQAIAAILPLLFLAVKCQRTLLQSYHLATIGEFDQNRTFLTKKNSNYYSDVRVEQYHLSGLFIRCHKSLELFGIDKEKEKKFKRNDWIRRICLIIFALLVLTSGSVITISVVVDLVESQEFCSSMNWNNIQQNKAVINDHPELLVYDHVCKRKLYNLFDSYPCNCALVMFENTMMINDNSTICRIHNNDNNALDFTSIDILNNIFEKWDMIVRFWFDQQYTTDNKTIDGCIMSDNDSISAISFDSPKMFASRFMQLFYIRNLEIDTISKDIAVYWKMLQYLSIPDTFIDAQDVAFEAIASMSQLKLIMLRNVNGLNISELCNLKNSLLSLNIEDSYFQSLDHCFASFSNLEYLMLNYNGIANIENWDILDIKTLKRLSLYANEIEYHDNDSWPRYKPEGTMLMEFYLGENPICDNVTNNSYISFTTSDLYDASCESGCVYECPIYNVEDGFCQIDCNTKACKFDYGDCNQSSIS